MPHVPPKSVSFPHPSLGLASVDTPALAGPHVERRVYSAFSHKRTRGCNIGRRAGQSKRSIIFIVYSVMDGRELLFSKRLVTLSSLNYFSVFEKKKKKSMEESDLHNLV